MSEEAARKRAAARPQSQAPTTGRSSFLGSVVSVGTTALAAFGAYQLASLAYEAWNEQSGLLLRDGDEQQLQQQQQRYNGTHQNNNYNNARSTARIRRQHLRHCRHHVRSVLGRFVPGALKRQILDATDFSQERRELKDLRTSAVAAAAAAATNNDDEDDNKKESSGRDTARELALWKTIQTQSVARLAITVYATTILFVMLTVQVSVLGKTGTRRNDNGNDEGNGEDDEERIANVRWVLDQTYQYMFQHGLPCLIQTTQRVVADLIPTEWNVLDPSSMEFTPRQLKDVLLQVHERLREDGALRRERSLLRFVQPPSVLLVQGSEEEEQKKNGNHNHKNRDDLLDETWDVLESPMVEDALMDSLHVLQTMLIHDVFEEEGAGEASELPLAQVLTQIKKVCQQFFAAFVVEDQEDEQRDQMNNKFLTALEHLPSVMETMDVCFW